MQQFFFMMLGAMFFATIAAVEVKNLFPPAVAANAVTRGCRQDVAIVTNEASNFPTEQAIVWHRGSRLW